MRFVANPAFALWRKTMTRPRLTAFCVLSIVFVVGSGVVCAQGLIDARTKFIQGYNDEFFQSPEQIQKIREFYGFSGQLRAEQSKTHYERIRDRLAVLNLEQNEANKLRIGDELSVDVNYAMQQPLADKMKELFPDAQQMRLRQFQMNEGIMRRLESLDDDVDLSIISERSSGPSVSAPLPDFLDLTPEQIELMKVQNKETFAKVNRLLRENMTKHPESMKEFNDLSERQSKLLQTQNEWSSSEFEEFDEIQRKLRQNYTERVKDILPQWKAILIEGRESYMRVLTDAQKAKIKAVMDDMPDYMKNLFAAIDKQGGGLSILNNWQPGMGVPDLPNPPREAPRKRTNNGGRTFSGH